MVDEARLEREREFHDRAFADNVRARTKRFYAVAAAMYRWYEQTLRDRAPGARVLEYGCGPGSQAFGLARAGAHVVGIDISPVAIEQATERGVSEGLSERLEFRVMDAENLEFEDDSFDLICGSGILHHLDLASAYAQVARVMRTDGCGVFTEPLGHNPAINAFRNRTPELRTPDEHPLLMSDLRAAERYFESVGTKYFTLTPIAAIPLRDRPRFDAVVSSLERVDDALFRLVPPLRRHAWMVGMTLSGPRSID